MVQEVEECGAEERRGASDVCEEAIKLCSIPFATSTPVDTLIANNRHDAARLLRMRPSSKLENGNQWRKHADDTT